MNVVLLNKELAVHGERHKEKNLEKLKNQGKTGRLRKISCKIKTLKESSGKIFTLFNLLIV